jgi:hypothetical protein
MSLEQDRLRPWAWYAAGAYLLIGFAWPMFGSKSFQKVTGRKEDMWLMSGISMQLAIAGTAIAGAAATDRITPEIAGLAIGTSASLAGLSIVNVARQRVGPVYLIDAIGHLTIAGGWLASLRGSG